MVTVAILVAHGCHGDDVDHEPQLRPHLEQAQSEPE